MNGEDACKEQAVPMAFDECERIREPQLKRQMEAWKRVKEYRNEYELATQIIALVVNSMKAHPDLNTCRVRAFCEMMLVN